MSKFKDDEIVYLRCKVSHAPEGDQRLYRLKSVSTGSVIWAEEDEMVRGEDGEGDSET